MNKLNLFSLLLLLCVSVKQIKSAGVDHTNQRSPADITYVNGPAPDELKAGPSNGQATQGRQNVRKVLQHYIVTTGAPPTIETVFESSNISPSSHESEEFNGTSATHNQNTQHQERQNRPHPANVSTGPRAKYQRPNLRDKSGRYSSNNNFQRYTNNGELRSQKQTAFEGTTWTPEVETINPVSLEASSAHTDTERSSTTARYQTSTANPVFNDPILIPGVHSTSQSGEHFTYNPNPNVNYEDSAGVGKPSYSDNSNNHFSYDSNSQSGHQTAADVSEHHYNSNSHIGSSTTVQPDIPLPIATDFKQTHRIANHQPVPLGEQHYEQDLQRFTYNDHVSTPSPFYLPHSPPQYHHHAGAYPVYHSQQPRVQHVPVVTEIPITEVQEHHGVIQKTINVPQHGIQTKTYEVRRPAVQKQYYDIEERVRVKPAGSVVLEIDQPISKTPTGHVSTTYKESHDHHHAHGQVYIQAPAQHGHHHHQVNTGHVITTSVTESSGHAHEKHIPYDNVNTDHVITSVTESSGHAHEKHIPYDNVNTGHVITSSHGASSGHGVHQYLPPQPPSPPSAVNIPYDNVNEDHFVTSTVKQGGSHVSHGGEPYLPPPSAPPHTSHINVNQGHVVTSTVSINEGHTITSTTPIPHFGGGYAGEHHSFSSTTPSPHYPGGYAEEGHTSTSSVATDEHNLGTYLPQANVYNGEPKYIPQANINKGDIGTTYTHNDVVYVKGGQMFYGQGHPPNDCNLQLSNLHQINNVPHYSVPIGSAVTTTQNSPDVLEEQPIYINVRHSEKYVDSLRKHTPMHSHRQQNFVTPARLQTRPVSRQPNPAMPKMISRGEPDFNQPPYVEVKSRGEPQPTHGNQQQLNLGANTLYTMQSLVNSNLYSPDGKQSDLEYLPNEYSSTQTTQPYNNQIRTTTESPAVPAQIIPVGKADFQNQHNVPRQQTPPPFIVYAISPYSQQSSSTTQPQSGYVRSSTTQHTPTESNYSPRPAPIQIEQNFSPSNSNRGHVTFSVSSSQGLPNAAFTQQQLPIDRTRHNLNPHTEQQTTSQPSKSSQQFQSSNQQPQVIAYTQVPSVTYHFPNDQSLPIFTTSGHSLSSSNQAVSQNSASESNLKTQSGPSSSHGSQVSQKYQNPPDSSSQQSQPCDSNTASQAPPQSPANEHLTSQTPSQTPGHSFDQQSHSQQYSSPTLHNFQSSNQQPNTHFNGQSQAYQQEYSPSSTQLPLIFVSNGKSQRYEQLPQSHNQAANTYSQQQQQPQVQTPQTDVKISPNYHNQQSNQQQRTQLPSKQHSQEQQQPQIQIPEPNVKAAPSYPTQQSYQQQRTQLPSKTTENSQTTRVQPMYYQQIPHFSYQPGIYYQTEPAEQQSANINAPSITNNLPRVNNNAQQNSQQQQYLPQNNLRADFRPQQQYVLISQGSEEQPSHQPAKVQQQPSQVHFEQQPSIQYFPTDNKLKSNDQISNSGSPNTGFPNHGILNSPKNSQAVAERVNTQLKEETNSSPSLQIVVGGPKKDARLRGGIISVQNERKQPYQTHQSIKDVSPSAMRPYYQETEKDQPTDSSISFHPLPSQSQSHILEYLLSTKGQPAHPIAHYTQDPHANYGFEPVKTRVVSATPASVHAKPVGEKMNTRRIVVNQPIETVQVVEEQEPITTYRQVTVQQPHVYKTHRQGVKRVETTVPVFIPQEPVYSHFPDYHGQHFEAPIYVDQGHVLEHLEEHNRHQHNNNVYTTTPHTPSRLDDY